jgi:mitochondrial fission protein ELM1
LRVEHDKGKGGRHAVVWLLVGHKAGDNAQVRALAARLGWPCEEKRIAYRPWELPANLLLGVTLAGMDRGRSDALAPPWPDLVITSGRRNEPVARWIRAQSGNRTRLVHIGRPWASPAAFDLVISTPQYAIDAFPNVLMNALPMHRVDAAVLAGAAAHWRERLGQLPRPRIAVLLGGDSGAYVFTPAKARRLGKLLNGLARSQRGSVLLTDSARTPPGVVDAVLGELEVPVHTHRWGGPREDNPYLGFLALADQFVVTADSMSMVAEAESTGQPVWLFSLDDGPGWWRRGYNYRVNALTHRLAVACGPRRMRRDVAPMLQALVREGRAAWLGEAMPVPALQGERRDDTAAAALAVAGLFAGREC